MKTPQERAEAVVAAMPSDLKHIRERHGAQYSYEYSRDPLNNFLASQNLRTSNDPIKQREIVKSFVVGTKKDTFDPMTILTAIGALKSSGLLAGDDNSAKEEAEAKIAKEKAEAEAERKKLTLVIGGIAAAVALILILK